MLIGGTGCVPADSGTPASDADDAVSGGEPSSPAVVPVDPWFTDRALETGIDFEHFNGMSGEYHLGEIMAPGAALFDMDNDGDLDVYLVQGQMLGAGKSLDDALIPPSPDVPRPLSDRLYRNDLEVDADGGRTLRFTDVTDGSGLDVRSYGMGVAAGDFDNDGWVDLYRTRLGANQLFRNNGDGTFRDISRRAGVGDAGWGVSASFLDIDRDGWLDLYVGNYVVYDPQDEERCLTPTGERDYCAPKSYAPAPDRLYRNRGNGTFTDVTASAGIGREYGPALGVLGADFNADGWVDIYVANDGESNQLWINRQDGTFANGALLAGVAVDRGGDTEASMGVDAGDFDADGDDDLFMTHVTAETNTLYVNVGDGFFEDRSAMIGLGAPSMPYTGFGTAWTDFDNDGWLDFAGGQRPRAGDGEPRGGRGPFPAASAQPVVPQHRRSPVRGLHRRGRSRVGVVRGQSRGGVRGCRQRWRRRRAGGEQQRSGASARQRGRTTQRMAWAARGGRRPAARHDGSARRGVPRRGPRTVAPVAGGRQLRVGQRSARRRGARRSGRGDRCPRRVAERAGRGVERRAGPKLDDPDRGNRNSSARSGSVSGGSMEWFA